MGLIKNCCGGKHYVPEVWTRTLATGPTNDANTWDFSQWTPDALVINLGTNDGDAAKTSKFVEAYQELVLKAHRVYGKELEVFLACGPMTTEYCGSVQKTLSNATAMGVKAYFLDQRGFLNGTFGPACCEHPSAQVDAAMGQAGADFIADTLGWSSEIAGVDLLV